MRGYLVTGDVGFLDPYFFGIDAFNKTMVEEQELTNDNQAAVAKLKEIHEMEQEWLSGYAEPAFELREKTEAGAVAQANFAKISARTIVKKTRQNQGHTRWSHRKNRAPDRWPEDSLYS